MKINQEFTVSRPLPVVWAFFHDVPRVAACLPGAEYVGPKEDGSHAGKVSAKVGPFQASFEGDAKVAYDEADKSVRLEGKGVDRKGASRGKMTMTCVVLPAGEATRVAVDADVQLSGQIAQFGRTGLITEVANVLVADFVRNVETELAESGGQSASAPSAQARPARPISGLSLLIASLTEWIKRLFRRT